MWISQENENSQGKNHRQPQKKTGAQEAQRLGLLAAVHSFPKQARILSKEHFHAVSRAKNRFTGHLLLIDYRRAKSLCPKLGITVSCRYGKANKRNRFKRLVREVFRLNYTLFPSDLEMNVIPKLPATKLSLQTIINDFNALLTELSCETLIKNS